MQGADTLPLVAHGCHEFLTSLSVSAELLEACQIKTETKATKINLAFYIRHDIPIYSITIATRQKNYTQNHSILTLVVR